MYFPGFPITKKHIAHLEHRIHQTLTSAGPFFIIQGLEKELKKAKDGLKKQHEINKKIHDDLEEQLNKAQEELNDDMDHETKYPMEATAKGKKIMKKRAKVVRKLEKKLDKHRGTDMETKWHDLIHHIKKKVSVFFLLFFSSYSLISYNTVPLPLPLPFPLPLLSYS